MEDVLNELRELKNFVLLGAKDALTMNEMSVFSGLSKSHLYKLACAKKIPHYKCGGKLTYFKKDEVTDYLLKYRVKTVEEVELEAVTYTVTGKKAKKNCQKA